jgi:hypothetical protein
VHFPHYGAVSMLLGVLKVYPALQAKCAETGERQHQVIIEIYDRSHRDLCFFAGRL